MDFAPTREQRALVTSVTEFARGKLADRAADSDDSEEFDRDGWQRCAEFGVLAWPVPARHGGSGLDPLSCVLAFEALGYACEDNGLLFAINNHVWAATSYLLAHGTPQQQAQFLPQLGSGSLIGAHALTEPGAGSDMLSLTTTARVDGGSVVLNGVKTFISNAPLAGLFVVFARSDPGASPQRGLSAFLVPADVPGVVVTRTWSKSGLRGCPMGEVRFDDARIPVEYALGAMGAGYQVFTSGIEYERGYMFASQVGTLRRLIERSVRHAASRVQFSQPIGEFQGIAHPLADLHVRLAAARLLLYQFGWLKQQGRLALLEASMLKLHVSESLTTAALTAMQVHGARGYLRDFGIEREVRDALATRIYGGTSEIQRSIIAQLAGAGYAG